MNDKMIYNAFDHMQPLEVDMTDSIMRQIKTNKTHAPVRYRVLKSSVCIMMAVIVMLLSVSGYAAVKLISVSLPEPGDNTDIQYIVERNDGAVKLSDGVMSDLKHYLTGSKENNKKAAYDFGRHFKDYSEVDEYLGISILKNPLLGETPANVMPKDIYLVAHGDENNIYYLSIYGNHTVPGASAPCFFNVSIKLNENKKYSSDLIVGNNNTPFYVDKDGNLTVEQNMKPEDKGISKVSSYTSAQNGIEAEIVVTTETLKHKVYEDIELTYTLNTIAAYFIHDNIMYSLRFISTVYEDYESEQATVTHPDNDPLTADDYVALTQNVIDAFIVN